MPPSSDPTAPSRDPDDPDSLSTVGVSHLQRLLHPACPSPLAPRISRSAALLALLLAFRRPHAALSGALGRLFAHPTGRVLRHQLHRLHLFGRLPQCTHPAASRLSC